MAKQLNVNLSVNADVKQAKAAFEDLQRTLTKIQGEGLSSNKRIFDVQNIEQASKAARELSQHLAAATDVNTGRLNLATFSSSLKSSGKTLSQYKAQLEAIGPSGEQAFTKVAKSIAMADNPLKRTNGLLAEFKTTLMNTARWQISSSILHGFMGALQTAYGYAQDLNESLNNIRIVTGYNIDKMAEFASEANKAAKALSTTTTDYTNASLIYYQQGLSDAEVKARTDATIKLANVSRQNAEEVSSQMTAIWNNFADGSKSLEYYADVITKLGASTASSSSEIAEGLQKFAATADTVGLSYEKATAALATVVAETRQSADVVGTAFKTMFARFQGLSLGETLEDGVDLNKYSKALATVGVNILDANGELKVMDEILDDTAEKWNQISEAQRIALAETVAGTRQYAQFMAIMNNYDKIQANQILAENSEGTIQKQADIYAESWEAAQKRVKAALENIYQQLIDDKFFIGANNFLAGLLEGVSGFIDGLGGVKGILSTVAAFIGQSLAKEAPAALARITEYVKQITGIARTEGAKMQSDIQKWAQGEQAGARDEFEAGGSGEYMVQVNMIDMLAEKKRQYNELSKDYSNAEKQRAQEEIAGLEQAGNALETRARGLDLLRDKATAASEKLYTLAKNSKAVGEDPSKLDQFNTKIAELEATTKRLSSLKTVSGHLSKLQKNFTDGKMSAEQYKSSLLNIAKAAGRLQSPGAKRLAKDIEELALSGKKADEKLDALAKDLSKSLENASTTAASQVKNLKQAITDLGVISPQGLDQFVTLLQKIGVEEADIPLVLQSLKDNMTDLNQHMSTGAEQLISFSSALMQVNAVMSSVQHLKDVFSDEDASAIEKAGAVIGALTTAMFAFNAVSKLTKTLLQAETLAHYHKAVAAKVEAGATEEEAAAEALNTGAKQANILTTIGTAVAHGVASAAKVVATLVTKGLTAALIELEAAASPVLVVTLLLTAAFATLVGIIAGAKWIIGLISDAYNKDAIAAEQAEQAAENLTKAYEESKQAYEDLKQSIESHNEALAAIEDMTKGTQEWKDSIRDANDKAMELINTLELIKGQDYEIDTDGIIRFKDGVLEAQEALQAQKVNQTQAASIMATANAKNLRAQSDLTNLKRDNHVSYIGNMLLGAGAGAATGTLVEPGAGTIAGAVIGGAAGLVGAGIHNAESDAKIESGISRLTEGDLAKQFQAGLLSKADLQKELKIDDADLVNAITELATTINANTDAQHTAAELTARTVLADNEEIQKSGYAEEISQAAGKKYEQAYYDEDNYNKYLKQAKSRGLLHTGTDESKKAMADYAKAMGLDQLKKYEVTNYKGDGTVEYKYIDDNGQEQKKLVTAEEIAATLAAADAAEQLESAAVSLIDTFKELDQSGKASDQALKDFAATGDLADSTQGEFDDLQKAISEAGSTQKFLEDRFGGADALAEQAQALGYASADEFVQAFQQELDETSEAWGELDLSDIPIVGKENLSFETAKALRDIFDQASLGPQGEAAGQEFIQGINKMLEGLDVADQQNALSRLTNIDWSSWDALEQVDAIMKEFGIDIDTSDSYWKKFASDMRIANAAQPDFSTLKDTLVEITGIISKLDFGSTISDEDYQKLVAYNDEWTRFFQLQADGTQKFIGDSSAMTKAMQDEIRQQKQDLSDRKDAQEGFNKANWGHDENGSWVSADWKNKSGTDTSTAQNLIEASGATQDMLETLGYTDKIIQDLITKATSGQADLVAEGTAQLREMYQRIGEFQDENLAEMDQQLDEMLASTATSLEALLAMKDEISAEAYDKQMSTLAMQASSLEELQRIQAAGMANIDTTDPYDAVGLSSYEYGEALLKLAEQFANTTDECEKYKQALLTGDEAQIDAARSALELAIETGEVAKKYGLDAQTTENYAKRLAKSFEEQGMSEKVAARFGLQAAVANQRLDRGLISLNKNLDTYKKKLKDTNKGSAEWSEAMDDLKTDLADVLNIDASTLTDSFGEAALESEDLQKALDGDVDAIRRLQAAAAEEIIATIRTNIEGDDLDVFNAQWEYLKANMTDAIESPGVDQSNLLASFNEMIAAGNMTKEQIETALAGLHVSANVKTTYVPQPVEVPQTITEEAMLPGGTATVQVPGPDGKWVDQTVYLKKKVTRTYDAGTVSVDGVVPQYEIEGTKGPGGITTAFATAPAPKASTGATKSGGAGGGGGKSAKHTAKYTDSEPHRYTKVENTVDSLSGQYDRLSKARERAWGVDKLSVMDSEIAKMEELSDAYKDYLKEVAGTNWSALHKKIQQGLSITEEDIKNSGGHLSEDYTSIIEGKTLTIVVDMDKDGNQTTKNFTMKGIAELLGEYGISGLDLDTSGKINNKDEIDTAFDQWYNAQEDYWNSKSGEWQESVEGKEFWTQVEAIKDAFPELFELYGEDIEKLIDNSDKLQENTYAIQDLKFDQLNEELELWLDVADRAAKHLGYAVKILGDSFYKIAEIMEKLYNPNEGSQYQAYLSTAEDYKLYYEEAKAMYAAGEISQAQFIEAAKKAQEGIYSVIDSILEMNEQMREYYDKALDGAVEELAKLTDQMDHQVEVMEHLKNVLSLLNKETDYKALSTLLKGTAEMRKNRLEVSTKEYEMFNEQRIKAEERYQQLLNDGLVEGAAEYKAAVLDKIVEQTAEAESKMYEDAEAYLEAINELYTNTINDIMSKQEKMLTGGFGYDFLTETMERANSIQDEYLTKTNQLYETNTLLRKLSQDIDKTDSVAAKTKLKNFSSEIEAMQKQEKLSQNDLEIAKARYEVLLAQIALEEAKNAKSTVRLQRDNEGNYGYVYTADQDKVADAEQNLADKQNDLYNLVLEQTNEYGEKIINLQKERDEALAALAEEYRDADGEKYEEYLKKKEALTNQYNELLYAAYDSYDKGIMWLNRTASTDYREAWVTEYDNVIDKGRDYETQTKDIISQIEEAMKDYEDQAKVVTDHVYLGVDNLEKKTSELVTANKNLADAVGDLIPKVQNEIGQVDLATEAWARHYEQIMANIQALMNYNAQINDAINAETYDKNTDYSQLMHDYLAKGGSMDDAEYKKLQRQREAKINGEKMSADVYGYRGEEFNNVLGYYMQEGLAEQYGSYFVKAFDAWAADNGLNAKETAKVSPEDYQANTEALKGVTEATNKDIEATEKDAEATDKNSETVEAAANTITRVGENAVDSIAETTTEAEEVVEKTTADVVAALKQNGIKIDTAANRVSSSVELAASTIASAAASIGSFGSKKFVSAATGTYTGEWGPEGKLAILHEKELVLNAADTENLLQTVDLVRELTSAIDLRAASSSLMSRLAAPVYQGGEQILEQQVTISAEFPNATNHNEIEEALSNLINRASQYANRY